MATQQTAAILVVFAILAAMISKWGRPRRPDGWTGWLGVKSVRRIGVLETRPLTSRCTLHLVRVDGQEFLLAQTGTTCTAVASWQRDPRGEVE
jgi:flagellar biogenesis protein FliO